MATYSSSNFLGSYAPSDVILKIFDNLGNRMFGINVCQYEKATIEDKFINIFVQDTVPKILEFLSASDAAIAYAALEVAIDALAPNCKITGGIINFNGQTGAVQAFANDTNVHIVSASNTHTLTWAGLLAVNRGGTNIGTYTTGDMLYASATNVLSKLPIGTNGQILAIVGGLPTWTADIDVSGIISLNGLTSTIQLFANDTNVTISSASSTHTLGWTGLLSVARGGTNIGTYTTGDILYASATNTLAKLPVGANGQVLTIIGGIPAWATDVDGSGITSLNGLTTATQTFANDTNVTITSVGSTHTLGWSGLLAINRGGTNIGTYTTGDMLYASATNVLSKLTIGTNGQVLTIVGGVPVWATDADGANSPWQSGSGLNSAQLIGTGSLSTGISSIAYGSGTLASGDLSESGGNLTTAIGIASQAKGEQSRALSRAEYAFASGQFANKGDAQYSCYIVRGETIGVTPIDLASGPALNGSILFENDKSYHVTIRLVGTTDGFARQTVVMNYEGLIETHAFPTLPNYIITRTGYSATSAGWDGTTSLFNGTVSITPSTNIFNMHIIGEASKNIRWVAFVEFVEVGTAAGY